VLRQWRSRVRARLGDDGARVRLLRGPANGRQTVACARTVTLDPPPAQIDAVLEALDRALRETAESGHAIAGLRCDVVVADAWMLYEVIDGDLGDSGRLAADEIVRAALADTAGVKPDELVARWQRQGASRNFACALPASVLQSLQAVLARHRLRLGSVNGELVRVFNANRHALSAPRSVLAVARPTGTQLGLVVDGAFAAVRYEPGINLPQPLLERSHALMRCAGFEPDGVTRYYADEALPAGAGSPWLGRLPPRRWPYRFASAGGPPRLDVDLSPAQKHTPRTGWLLLGAGAAAVALAASHFQSVQAERMRAERALQSLAAALDKARSGNAVASTPADARSARATAAVVRELQVPWATLLAALESVAGRNVALLAVEPSALRREVRIVAEARSSDAMLDYLDALRAQSLRDVVLVSHQTQPQTPGTPIRFQARASWGADERDAAKGTP
jgi:hypothetical protein